MMNPDGEKRGRAFRLYQGNRRNQNNICDQPCVFTNMYFGPPVKVTLYTEFKVWTHLK